MNSRVAELFEIIRKAEAELANIRSVCLHTSWFVGFWSWRPGSDHPSRICNECQNCIPGITDEEAAALWKTRPQPTAWPTFSTTDTEREL